MMEKKLEKVYEKSPVIIQNCLISLYGLKLQHIRYGGKYQSHFRKICDRLGKDRNQIKDYINHNVKRVVETAYDKVQYYRNCFHINNIDVRKVKKADDLKRLPLLEKETIRKNSKLFINNNMHDKGMVVLKTTGSTGTPLKIYTNKDTRRKNFAFFNRFLNNVGISYKGKRATFWGRTIVSVNQIKPPFWRYSKLQKNLIFSSYHMNEENLPLYIKKLKDYRPDYIDAYPSSLYTIALYAIRNGISLKGCTKGLTTSAETLYKEQREIIEDAFSVPLYDQYGSAEMCNFVAQCKEGKYHIHDDYSILEFLNADGKDAKYGEEAEIICTSFINPIMPLIRYRIGDRGILSDEKCSCGLPFPIMGKILGRNDDVIITPNGRNIGRLSPVMKGFSIKKSQFVQIQDGSVEILIEKGYEYRDEDEKGVINEIRKRLGNNIKLRIKYVKKIPAGAGGKFKSIISEFNRNKED